MTTLTKSFDSRTFSMNAEYARNVHNALEQEIINYATSRTGRERITEAQLNLLRQYQTASALTHDLLDQLSSHLSLSLEG